MRPDPDGNYVAYHEYQQEVDELEYAKQELLKQREELEKDVKLYKGHANTWKNLYEYKKELLEEMESHVAYRKKLDCRFNIVSLIVLACLIVYMVYK